MSDLERAMNPGGFPGPMPTTAQEPEPPAEAKLKRGGRRGVARKGQGKGRKRRAATVAIGKRRSRVAKVAKAVRKPTRRGRADVTMDLAGTMELLGSMHRTDVPVFQVISEALSSRAKPSRRRLLAAIQKVFG